MKIYKTNNIDQFGLKCNEVFDGGACCARCDFRRKARDVGGYAMVLATRHDRRSVNIANFSVYFPAVTG